MSSIAMYMGKSVNLFQKEQVYSYLGACTSVHEVTRYCRPAVITVDAVHSETMQVKRKSRDGPLMRPAGVNIGQASTDMISQAVPSALCSADT